MEHNTIQTREYIPYGADIDDSELFADPIEYGDLLRAMLFWRSQYQQLYEFIDNYHPDIIVNYMNRQSQN